MLFATQIIEGKFVKAFKKLNLNFCLQIASIIAVGIPVHFLRAADHHFSEESLGDILIRAFIPEVYMRAFPYITYIVDFFVSSSVLERASIPIQVYARPSLHYIISYSLHSQWLVSWCLARGPHPISMLDPPTLTRLTLLPHSNTWLFMLNLV
jgi:hypothetical protein